MQKVIMVEKGCYGEDFEEMNDEQKLEWAEENENEGFYLSIYDLQDFFNYINSGWLDGGFEQFDYILINVSDDHEHHTWED